MGLGRMADVSDIDYQALVSASENFIRSKDLPAMPRPAPPAGVIPVACRANSVSRGMSVTPPR